MNVYDFDDTIYKGNSERHFYFHCLKRYPEIALYLPYQLVCFISFGLKKINKTELKERFYKFLPRISDIDCEVEDFWKTHMKNIKKWYLDQQKEDDVIISASPYFLLEPACKKIGILHLLASNVDKYSGVYNGNICFGKEKVPRFEAEFENEQIDQFYSDSDSDSPLAYISKMSFKVLGDKIFPWN